MLDQHPGEVNNTGEVSGNWATGLCARVGGIVAALPRSVGARQLTKAGGWEAGGLESLQFKVHRDQTKCLVGPGRAW